MVWFWFLVLFVTFALAVISLTTVLNALVFPRLGRKGGAPETRPSGRVSVLIPARDEAANIEATVRKLLAQPLPDLEVIVLDDNSQDGTAALARQAGAGDPRLSVASGAPLPPGWHGKNWACEQLARQARGEVLVFTDADVSWEPGALPALLALLEREQADLLTVWPTQRTVTWGERLVVPLMAFAIYGYLPLPAVHFLPLPAFAAANGQCLAFRRPAYEAVGGHAAVKNSVVEDVTLARRVKQKGLRLRMADGGGLVHCRMYDGWPAARDGYAKNILAGHGDSPLFLALSTVFHWLVFLFPPLWLLLGGLNPAWPGEGAALWPAWPLALTAMGIASRALSAAATRQRTRDAWLLPLSVLLMTRIAAQAVYWRFRYGGPQWKGRTLLTLR